MTPQEQKDFDALIKLTKDYKSENESLKTTISEANNNTSGTIGDQTAGWSLSLDNLTKVTTNASNALTNTFNVIGDSTATAFGELDELGTGIQQSFGASKARLDEFRFSIAETSPELMKMGLTSQDASNNFISMAKSLGTAASIGNEAIIEMSAASQLTGQDVGTLTSEFREVGVSIYDVGDQMKDVANYAKSVGLSVNTVSAGVVGNLSKMNLYNFEGGIKGLTSMAGQAARLGISMDQVFRLGENLMDPDKAIDMSAALQRLGVTSSALLDPLKAMDLAQNDPAALQNEMVNISKEFTKFNEESGKMEIMPGAKRRLREVAEAMGMTAEDLAKMSINAADFDRKMSQIEFPELAKDPETKEMIASMAQLKDGKAMINVKNEQTGEVELKQVDQLTSKDIESLKNAQDDSSKTVEQLAVEQLSELKQIDGSMKSLIASTNYGKATVPALSKLFYGLKGIEKGVANAASNNVTTAGVRGTVGSIAQPAEDIVVGMIKGDVNAVSNASVELLDNAHKLTDAALGGLKQIGTEALESVKKTLIDSYGNKGENKSTSDVNMKLDVNVNGGTNMTKEEVHNIVVSMFNDTKVKSELMNGTNYAPVAATGPKNL
jgi:hypothetical protein